MFSRSIVLKTLETDNLVTKLRNQRKIHFHRILIFAVPRNTREVSYMLLHQLPSTSPPEEAIFERLKYVVPTTSFFVRRSLQKEKKKII